MYHYFLKSIIRKKFVSVNCIKARFYDIKIGAEHIYLNCSRKNQKREETVMVADEILKNKADRKTRETIIGKLLLDYGFLSRNTIGESRCARPVDLLCVGNRQKQVLFAGAFHGMEWITSLLLLKFLDELCFAVMTGRSMCGVKIGAMLNQRGLAVIPCVNPDGVEIQINGAESAGSYEKLVTKASGGTTRKWQANAAGVDINHNFSANWEKLKRLEMDSGIRFPSPTRYGGEFPESEPESRTIASYCRSGNITHALAFHSQGEEIYWDFGDYHDAEALKMAKIMSYSCGYRIGEPTGLASGGGFKDWFEEKFRRPAFTIEVGKGENPLPIEDFDAIYQKIREMLVLAVIL